MLLGFLIFPLSCYVAFLCMSKVCKVKKYTPKGVTPTENTASALPETPGLVLLL